MQDSQTQPRTTAELLQNELEKKWAREQAEKEREERLYDQPIGPDPVGYDPRDELAHYEFYGGLEEGDVIEWDDGCVAEVIATIPAQQTRYEEEPLGEIVHYRILEPMDNPDEYTNSLEAGEQTCQRDYNLGGAIARGEVEIRD